MVRVCDADPDLVAGLSRLDAEAARRHVLAQTVRVEPGQPLPLFVASDRQGPRLGVLVLQGLLLRRLHVHARASVELLGAGDVLRPLELGTSFASVPAAASWRVCEPVQLALLDAGFEATAGRWPGIFAELLGRVDERANSLAVVQAINQLPRLEARIELLLWHLSDRWGRVEPDGVAVPLSLSQQTLAELVSARRPSVNAALRGLVERGVLQRRSAGGWLLCDERPVDRLELVAPGGPAPAMLAAQA